ncbi:MAG TPA: O-antigen ligase family protein, partial [Candidatus Limnocylindrales bacterium]|nr:O-antigen ligase family protein [Candidatus Limnocylindrales bacterium]
MSEENLGARGPGAHSPAGAGALDALPVVLLYGFLGAAACVPDEAILRSKVAWTEGLMLLAAAAALLVQLAQGRIRAPWPVLLVGSLIPGAVAWLMSWTREDLISASLARDEAERLLLFPLAFWCVAATVCRPQARRLFLGALSLAVLVVAALAVAQNLAVELSLPVNRYERPPSTFGNPVFLAAFLVLTTPVCAVEALFATGWRRWAGSLATGLALPALLATRSRWAWLGFAVALCLGTTLLAPAGRWRRRLLVGLLAGGLLMLLLNQSVLRRPQQHALIWRDTLAMVSDRPWGIGPGQFPVAFLDYASAQLLEVYPPSAFVINDAHNEPLQILAELGWPGLAAIVLLAALLLRHAAQSLTDATADPAERPLRVACLAALSGALVQSLGSPDLRFVVSTLMFGAIAGLTASFNEPVTLRVPGPRAARVVLGLLVILGAGFALRSTWKRLQLAELLQPAATVQPALPVGSSEDLVAQRRDELAADPLNASKHYALGLALALQHRYAEAAESFRTAL